MNYADLCTAVEAIAEDDITASVLATLVKQAEQKLYHAVRLPSLRKNVTGSFTSGNRYLSAPEDFLAVSSLAAIAPTTGVYTYLIEKDVDFIREAYPVPATTGVPKYYAMFGPQSGDANELTFLIGPTPPTGYTAELHYFFVPESIVTASDTWLGENFDSALLNGVLLEVVRYQKGEQDMVKMYTEMYQDSLALLKNLSEGKQRTDEYRTGQPRAKAQ